MFSRYKHPLVAATMCVSCLLAAVPQLPAVEITLPPETAKLVESPLPGYATALALCSTCHSADYQRMQPPNLPRAYWKATVVKMQKTFGAPIPDEAIEPIVDYLVKTYGAERATVSSPGEQAAPKKGR